MRELFISNVLRWGGSKYTDTPLVAPIHRVLLIVVRRWTLTCR